MPEIGRIQSTNFQSLLTDLGITRNNIPFGLQSEVMPVVLVGGTVSFLASPTPAYRVQDIFTAGFITAPAAGSLLADSGPLPQGAYTVELKITTSIDTNQVDLEWRNAANTAILQVLRLFNSPNGPGTTQFLTRFLIENDNERFILRVLDAGNAGVIYQGVILVRT